MADKIDVFIIDDDANNMQYFQSIIRNDDNIRCIGSTTSSNTAIDVVVTTQPDVVLVDYALYPISGFEILKQLRLQMPDLPIVLLGGRSNLREKAESAGASAYLPMPITPRNLLDTIKQVTTSENILPD